ncbi:MAG: ABC transporter permease [Gordonia sp. (in: high G+C Gram-positive bacteria)]
MATTLNEPDIATAVDDEPTAPHWAVRLLARYDSIVYGIIGLLVFLTIWWWLVASGNVDSQYLSTPQDTVRAFFSGLADGTLAAEIWPSVQRALIGFAIALVAGITIGIFVGSLPLVQKFAEPVLLFFRNLSLLALLPVFVVFLGIGEASKVAIVAWACFWSIFITTVGAVRSVDRTLLNAARTLGAGRVYIFTKVVLPASIPGIFPGIRLAASNAFTALVAAELVGGAHGLGIYINNAALRYQAPQMYAGILALGLIGIFVNSILTVVQSRLTRWQRGLAIG